MIFDYKGITNKNKDLIFVAGPCVIESEEMTMTIAKKLKEIKDKLNIQLIFKGSFDKAEQNISFIFQRAWNERGTSNTSECW
ncbi:hypothetical protein OFQ49_12905 [Brachyspira hyodysenteriae]|nr:hypothetical protein [Brachyspira hyodysenteriae]MCZ9940174.1 hypothetical protein [Brachyspira hyodysenteriae]MDA0024823.1 hypothetical protein [Brachyspira hyodysenteriae]